MELDKGLLEQLYDNQPLTVDMLPHTLEEDALVDAYNLSKGTNVSKREIFITLTNMRKKQQLKPKGRKKNAPAFNRHRDHRA